MRVQNYKKIAVGWSRKRLFLNFIAISRVEMVR